MLLSPINLLVYRVIRHNGVQYSETYPHVLFYNTTASSWTLATPRTTWESDVWQWIDFQLNRMFIRWDNRNSMFIYLKICILLGWTNRYTCAAWPTSHDGMANENTTWKAKPSVMQSPMLSAPHWLLGMKLDEILFCTKCLVNLSGDVWACYNECYKKTFGSQGKKTKVSFR